MSTVQDDVTKAFGSGIEKYVSGDPRDEWHYYAVSKVKTDYALINRVGLRGEKVLNVGGYFPIDEIFFARIVKEFHSIDLSEKVIDFAKKVADAELSPALRKKLHFRVADASRLPFDDGTFDVSMSFSTLEHIPDEEKRNKAFSEMARVTKKGGHVIITVPNKMSLGCLHTLLRKKKTDEEFGYEHWYTPGELKKIMIRNGLKPLWFASSAGDFSGSAYLLTGLYNWLTSSFGRRMGWTAIKE